MIKCCTCTQDIVKKHYDHFNVKCDNILDAFIKIFEIIDKKITNQNEIKDYFLNINKTNLKTAGVVIPKRYSYKPIEFDTEKLIKELSNNNIKNYYINNSFFILKLLQIIKKKEILKDILVGSPKRLEDINNLIFKQCNNKLFQQKNIFHDEIKKILTKIFNYNTFRGGKKWNARQLKLKLDVKSCLYCNLQIVSKTGYPFDHFLDQSKYPLFSISLFNLIPSCSNCNTNNKGGKPFSIETHIHPHYNDFPNEYNFDLEFKNNNILNSLKKNKEYNIVYSVKDSKIKDIIGHTFGDLDLLAEYNDKKHLIDNTINCIYFNNKCHIESAKNLLQALQPNVTLTPEEIYSYLFNKPLKREDFSKFHFSRLTYDLCKSTGFLDILEASCSE